MVAYSSVNHMGYCLLGIAGMTTAGVIWPASRGAKTLDWTVPDVFEQELFEKYGTPSLLEEARAWWQRQDLTRQEAFRFLHVSTDEVYGSLGADAPAERRLRAMTLLGGTREVAGF